MFCVVVLACLEFLGQNCFQSQSFLGSWGFFFLTGWFVGLYILYILTFYFFLVWDFSSSNCFQIWILFYLNFLFRGGGVITCAVAGDCNFLFLKLNFCRKFCTGFTGATFLGMFCGVVIFLFLVSSSTTNSSNSDIFFFF